MSVNREEELFEAALDIDSEAQRKEYLDLACGHDRALRARVAARLEAHRKAESYFRIEGTGTASSPIDTALASESQGIESLGATIGRFKLLQVIGEGGMGLVYMAEQFEPVRRKVALKIIKLGMDTKQVIARFEAERQALAMMDHPSIAQVLDGGCTESGRPYFVMELVKGIPITEFCQKNQLNTCERLALFIQVCQAVQSAHQKGIIHRDLKPSNILVTLHHGEPLPKVIDFGIAKATNQRLTEKTLFTNYAQMVGTPAYMSPEQAEMSSLDVDSRTDIYSLGVLLYELLTDSTPFPESQLLSKGYGEMQRIISEEFPEKPSTRLTKLNQSENRKGASGSPDPTGGLRQYQTRDEPRKLAKLIQGDLDWITLKCLEKDRRRRYGSPNELAADLAHHMADEPVSAAAPSLSYQASKAYRRHRTLANAAAIILLLLVITAIANGSLAIKMNQARIQSDRLREASDQERDRALRAEADLRQRSIELEDQHYASSLLTIDRAVRGEDWYLARKTLQQHLSTPSGRDLRGFEWRYFHQKSEGEHHSRFQAHDEQIEQLNVSPDGRWLATAGLDGWVKVWNLANNQLLHSWQHHERSNAVDFTNEEGILISSGSRFDWENGGSDNSVYSHDILSNPPISKLIFDDAYFAVSPSGTAIALSSGRPRTNVDGNHTEIRHWDRETLEEWKLPSASRHTFARFSGSGNRLALFDRTWGATKIDIWDVNTKEQVASVPTTPFVRSLDFSPAERHLATAPGMTDRATKLMVIQVHDLRQQQSTTRLVGHKGRVNEVRFHPIEDHLLVSGSDDKSIRLWDWREKKTVRRLTGQGARVRSLTLTPDGEQIISGGSDGSIVRWNITAPRVAPERIPHAHVVLEPIFSRNNDLMVLDRWNELWDSSESPLRVEPITLPPPRKQSNQDSSLESIPTQQESTMKPSPPLFVVEVQRIKSLDDLPEEGSSTLIVALDDDNRLAFKYFPGRGTPLTFTEELYRDRPSQLAALKNRIEALGNRSSLSVSQQSQIREDYQEIVKDSPPSQRVWGASVYDSNTCEPVWNLSPLEHCLGFSPDDRFLLTLTSDEIFYREARTGQLDHSVEISTPIENPNFGRRNRVRAYALSPNGAQLSVAEYPPTLRVIATDTGKTIHTMNDGNLIEHHQYFHSGEHILFKGVKGAGIWTPGSDQSTYLYRTRAWFVRHLALSHDDQTVAGICSDNVIRIWSVPSGEIVHVIREIQDHIISISFSSDGRTLAVVRHGAPNIELWNTRTWRRLCELPYRSDLSAAVFSPDGRFLISSDQDGARLWRAPLLGEIDNAIP